MIEVYILSTYYQNYSELIIESTRIRVHYTMETMSELVVAYIDYQKEGFH